MVVRNKPVKPIDFDHATDAQLRAKINQTMKRLIGKNNQTVKVGMAYVASINKELERRKNGN